LGIFLESVSSAAADFVMKETYWRTFVIPDLPRAARGEIGNPGSEKISGFPLSRE